MFFITCPVLLLVLLRMRAPFIKALLLSQKPTEIPFNEAEKIQQLFLLLQDFKQLSFLLFYFSVKCNCRFKKKVPGP